MRPALVALVRFSGLRGFRVRRSRPSLARSRRLRLALRDAALPLASSPPSFIAGGAWRRALRAGAARAPPPRCGSMPRGARRVGAWRGAFGCGGWLGASLVSPAGASWGFLGRCLRAPRPPALPCGRGVRGVSLGLRRAVARRCVGSPWRSAPRLSRARSRRDIMPIVCGFVPGVPSYR